MARIQLDLLLVREMDDKWFHGSVDYWSKVEATVNGVLGGYAILHAPDIRESKILLQKHISKINHKLALDIGAGIGRVSKHLLAPFFEQVSILESDARFVEKAKEELGSKMHQAYNCRLQDFICDEPGIYDLIWIQWVLVYCSDSEMLSFFNVIKKSLKEEGLIGIKENTINDDREPDIDTSDCSIVRSRDQYLNLFEAAGLELIDETIQKGFPASLYPVRMFILKIRKREN